MKQQPMQGRTRVVSEIHALIAELSSHFIYPVQATDNQHLQVQLGGNTQEHVHVQVVVVSNEGLGSGTASNWIKHGSLHRDEVTIVEPATNIRVDFCTSNEDLPRLLIHHEIEVALAETSFGVLEAIVIVGDLGMVGQQIYTGQNFWYRVRTWCKQGARRVTSTAAMDNSPEKSPEPCLVLGLVRVGKPRIPVAHLISTVQLKFKKSAPDPTNDITSSEVDMLIIKGRSLVVKVVGLSKNLKSHTLRTMSKRPIDEKCSMR